MRSKPAEKPKTEQTVRLFHGVSFYRILHKKTSTADAFQIIGFSCLRDLEISRDLILTGDEAEGIHQMRIGVRRLRAEMSVFKDMLHQDSQTPEIKSQLKWLVSQLAPARDLHVFQTESVEPIAEQQPEEFEALKTSLTERKDHAFTQAREAVQSKKYHDGIEMLSRWLLIGGWMRELDDDQSKRLAGPVLDFAHAMLNERIRKVVNQSKHLDELEPTHRHELRIMIKKLRYSLEFFGGIFPRKTISMRRKTLMALTRLQDSLGNLNDIAVDKLAHGVLQLPKNDETVTAYAAGMVTGQKQTKVKPLLKKAMKAASDLRKHRTIEV